jgi:predicted SAM-dependent methyltransferase
MRLINLGCGNTFHSDWTNLDFVSTSPAIREWDLRKGLPFLDESFDACYSSHVLEHLTQNEASRLLSEIQRILKPGGVARIVVPDFEAVAKDYLACLERGVRDGESTAEDYQWIVIQMMDQSVRKIPGGEMSRFWRDTSRNNDAFVIARAGLEAENVIRQARGEETSARRPLSARVRSKKTSWFLKQVRIRIARLLVHAVAGREAADSFTEGLFRNSGEIHQWIYDRYSLARLLGHSGFANPTVCTANDSLIPNFSSYELDVLNGRVRKPDSLFMEAMKPSMGY